MTFNLPRGVKPLTGDNVWVKANDEGKAELQVVSVTAGTYEITASAGNSQPSDTQTITFVADKATATVSGIEVIGNYALADGKAKQTYKVTVTDANNNLVKDSDVTLTASPASSVFNVELDSLLRCLRISRAESAIIMTAPASIRVSFNTRRPAPDK